MSLPKAVATGVLRFGEVEVDCYVLDDERRVISQRGVLRGITGDRTGGKGGDLRRYLRGFPGDIDTLSAGESIDFAIPSGGRAQGRNASWFVDFCAAYVDAAVAGTLHPKQTHLAVQAQRVLKAVAKVGIVALVDEATGYEFVREHGLLARLFEQGLREEADRWEPRWHAAVVEPLCGVFDPKGEWARQPEVFPVGLLSPIGKLYRILMGIDLYGELKRRNPSGEERTGHKHHQWMTEAMLRNLSKYLEVIRALAQQYQGNKDGFYAAVEQYAGRRAEAVKAGTLSRDDELQLALWDLFDAAGEE